MVAVEIRKNGGFPQATGNRKPTQHFFYSRVGRADGGQEVVESARGAEQMPGGFGIDE